jgi:hypothetical protein
MGSVDLNEIIREGRSATRHEMNLLFKDYVCQTTCIRVVKMMDERELKRILAVHLLDYHVAQIGMERKVMVHYIGVALHISKSTIYRWFPAKEFDSEMREAAGFPSDGNI